MKVIFLLFFVWSVNANLVYSPGPCPAIKMVMTYTPPDLVGEFSKIGSSREVPFVDVCNTTRTVWIYNDTTLTAEDAWIDRATNKRRSVIGKGVIVDSTGLMIVKRQGSPHDPELKEFQGGILRFERFNGHKIVVCFYCNKEDDYKQEEIALYVTGPRDSKIEAEALRILVEVVNQYGLQESLQKFKYSPLC